MYDKIAAVNFNEHANKALKEISGFTFASSFSSCLVGIDEYFEACKDYAVLFAKDAEGKWFALALLGVKEGRNLFIDSKGAWEARRYIPAFFRRYPFIFANTDSGLILAIADGMLEDKNENNESKTIFQENGELTPFMQEFMNFMNTYQVGLEKSRAFIEDLESWGLLEEKSIALNDGKENFNIQGFFVINEEKLNHLSEKRKSEICQKGAIPFITAHLMSLSNINKLPAA